LSREESCGTVSEISRLRTYIFRALYNSDLRKARAGVSATMKEAIETTPVQQSGDEENFANRKL